MTTFIGITKAAAQHIQQKIAKSPHAVALRLAIKKSGCSGFKYEWSMTNEFHEDEERIEQEGAVLIISKKDLPYVIGSELDYVTEGLNRKLQLNNPNAKNLCGCKESFSL